MLRICIFILTAFGSGTTLWASQEASNVRFRPLNIQFGSVQLETVESAANHYCAILSFQTAPQDSCNENYAGAFEMSQDRYQIVSKEWLGQRCHGFGAPSTQTIRVLIFVHQTKSQLFYLNAKPFHLVADESNRWTLVHGTLSKPNKPASFY